jgi:hypothetical protein
MLVTPATITTYGPFLYFCSFLSSSSISILPPKWVIIYLIINPPSLSFIFPICLNNHSWNNFLWTVFQVITCVTKLACDIHECNLCNTWHSLLRTVYANSRTATSQQQTWPLCGPVALCSMGWRLNLCYKPKRWKTWRVLSLWFHPGCIKCLRLKICFHVCPQYWLHNEFIVTLPTTLTTSPKRHLNVHSFAQQ